MLRVLPIVFIALVVTGDIEDTQRSYERELRKLEEEHRQKVAKLNEKYLKIASKEIDRATKAGRLDDALAWREWSEELDSDVPAMAAWLAGTKNLASQAKVIATSHASNPASVLVDGVLANLDDVRVHRRQYWVSPQKPAEVSFRFERPFFIVAVKMATPDEKMNGDGAGIPLDYTVECFNGAEKVAAMAVKDGKHHLVRSINEKGWKDQGLWITTFLPKPIRCQEVRFACSRSSGPDRTPLLYEVEILGK